MAFMTAATMRNPNTLGNVLTRMSEDKLLKRKQERISQVAQNIMDGISSLSPEQRTNMDNIMEVTKAARVPGMTGQELNLAATMAFQYQQHAQKQQSYNRNNDLFNRQKKKADTQERDAQIIDQMQYPKQYGDTAYEAPAGDLMGELSPQGRSSFMQARNKAAIDANKRSLDEDKIRAEILYKKAQAKNIGRNGSVDKTSKQDQSNAIADLQMHFGEKFDPDTNTILIPTDSKGNPKNPEDLQFINQAGFNFDTPDKVIKTDSSHFFGAIGDDKYARVVRLGGYNGAQKIQPISRKDNEFDKLYQRIQGRKKKVIPPSFTVNTTKETKPVKETPKKVYPKDIKTWDVTRIKKNGKLVPVRIMDDGTQKQLTNKEYLLWKMANRTNVFKKLGIKKTNKKYTPQINPFKRI